jgi:cysteine synthase
MVCAQKGYPLVITMAETFSVERRKLMRFLGAKVVLTPAALRGMGMVTKVPPADSRSQISDFFIPWRRAPRPMSSATRTSRLSAISF